MRGLCAKRLDDVDMAYNRLSGFGATQRRLSAPLGLPRDDELSDYARRPFIGRLP